MDSLTLNLPPAIAPHQHLTLTPPRPTTFLPPSRRHAAPLQPLHLTSDQHSMVLEASQSNLELHEGGDTTLQVNSMLMRFIHAEGHT